MGSLISAIGGSAKKAAKAQRRGAEDANRDLGAARDENIARLQPIADIGMSGINDLAMYTGTGGDASNPLYGSLLKQFTGEDLANTPGYQFGLEQGQLGLDRKAASAGNFLSGAALKAASRYGQDYAGTKFQEGYNRDALDKTRISDFLGNIANMGINATDKINDTRFKQSLQYGQNTMGAANATAAGIIGQGNAWDNVLNTGLSAALAGATMGMGGGLGAAGAATAGGAASQNAMQGFSQNMLNPNFASNYMGLKF